MSASKPKKVDNFTQGCTCENCGKSLHTPVIWIWEEHFACSKTCVEICYYEARPELVVAAEIPAPSYGGIMVIDRETGGPDEQVDQ